MKVVKWIAWDDAEPVMDVAVDLMGGFFSNGMRWADYIQQVQHSVKELAYLEALREAVQERNCRYTGQDHQGAQDGVPQFEDGTVAMFSFRAWGDLLAAIWSTAENKDYNYMDFYC